MKTEKNIAAKKRITIAENVAKREIAEIIKKNSLRKLKLNIFFFILGASTGFSGLTYFGALDINCLAEKGYAPQTYC